MSEDELIEKMARAMCDTWGYLWDGEPNDEQTAPETCVDIVPGKSLYREAARAALAAIREAGCVIVPSDIRRAFYFPIEMPVTKDGQGPAKVGVDAEQITYEVWDQLLSSHGSHNNLPDAINQANALNDRDISSASPLKGET